jgi:predicted transcriptional regulator
MRRNINMVVKKKVSQVEVEQNLVNLLLSMRQRGGMYLTKEGKEILEKFRTVK